MKVSLFKTQETRNNHVRFRDQSLPIPARFRDHLGNIHPPQLLRLLNHICVQSRANIPGDIVIKRPDSRAIQLIRNHHVPRLDNVLATTRLCVRNHLPTTSDRDGLIESMDGPAPLALSLGEDPVAMAMGIHEIGSCAGVVEVD